MDITSNLSIYYDCGATTGQWDNLFPDMNMNTTLIGCDNVTNDFIIISNTPKTNNFIYSCKGSNAKGKHNVLIEHLQSSTRFLVFIHFIHLGVEHFKLLGKAKVSNHHQETNTFKIVLQTKPIIKSKEISISHLSKNKKHMSVH